ncbi:MAG TPA: secretin N-terminal domain-containing protein, partial [Pirellulales bacterium]|nr:secretin N-terminal domain-containing protein [Pirellulales bacterium]
MSHPSAIRHSRLRVARARVGLPLTCVLAMLPALSPGAERPGDFKAYGLQRTQAAAVEPLLRQALSALPEKAEVAVDARANRLLVRGPAEVQKLAQELIRSLDRADKAIPAGVSVLKTYAYAGADAVALAARLQAKYAADRRVRIAADQRTRQILVVAPPEMQPQIAQQLNLPGAGARPPQSNRSAPNRAAPNRSAAAGPLRPDVPPRPAFALAAPSAVRLTHAAPDDVERKLQELWQGRLAPVVQTTPDVATLIMPFAGQPALEV